MGFGDRPTRILSPPVGSRRGLHQSLTGLPAEPRAALKPWDRDRRHGGPSPTVKGRHTASHRQAQAGKAELWPACGPGR